MKKTASMIAAAVCIAWPGTFAWAQTPGVQLPHGNVFPGAAPPAPAMSLKNIPPHPAESSGLVPKMTHVSPSGTVAHMMPTPHVAAARRAAGLVGTPPLLYHTGGSIMLPHVQVFNIYWKPATLQTGTPTTFGPTYGLPTLIMGAWMQGHGTMNIATQYFQTIAGTTTYFQSAGGLTAFVVDTGPYPASGCTDTLTPGNCITDAQIQAKIAAVMAANGWTGGMNKIFMLYTSQGEGSCFDSTNISCAYTQYCAYHSFFPSGGQNVIYANIPFGDPNHCQQTGQTTPNSANGDLAANVASHEIMEAVTDPLLDAWFDSTNNEIGDLCNFNFGVNTWGTGAGAGNQMWNGVILEIQQEWDNHANACVQVGPQ